MIDIMDVEIQQFEAEAIKGIAVLPASDMKKVVIPSPPSVRIIPINPRSAVIYITDAEVSDELKLYAKENKMVFLIPEKGSAEDVATVYAYATSKAKKLNIEKNKISVKADKTNLELAAAVVDVINEEDYVDDAEELAI